MSITFIQFPNTLQESIFVERPNRFLIYCQITCSSGSNQIVAAHLPDSGRLKELLVKGRKLWLEAVNHPKRKTSWSAVLVETEDRSGLVSLNSAMPNRLVEIALKNKEIAELRDWCYTRREYTYKGSRWDFLLEKPECRLALEVKVVSLVENKIGYFPDAVTTRGARHVQELTSIAADKDWQGALLFIAQRRDLEKIMPCERIDPFFAQCLRNAKEAGVKLIGRTCKISFEGIYLGESVPIEV